MDQVRARIADALTIRDVAEAVSASMLADLTSTFGRIYKHGSGYGMSTPQAMRRVRLHADELNELIGPEFVQAANKGGGAGLYITGYSQTAQDIEAKVGSTAKAEQIDVLLEEITDRFGKLPPQGQTLFDVHRLRVMAKPFGVTKIDAAPALMVISFRPNPPVEAMKIIELVQKNRHIKLAGNDKLRIERELKDPKDEQLNWRSLDLDFWKGDEIFLQITTAADLPAEFKDGRSWFGLTDVAITKDKTPPVSPKPSTASPHQLITGWQNDALTEANAFAMAHKVGAEGALKRAVNTDKTIGAELDESESTESSGKFLGLVQQQVLGAAPQGDAAAYVAAANRAIALQYQSVGKIFDALDKRLAAEGQAA